MLAARVSDYVLEIVEGPDAGRQVALGHEPLEIGRDASVGISIATDPLVSRHHARLSPTGSGVVIEDLGSSNGTFVDGDEIHSPAVLTTGGKLTVGVTVLELRTAVQAAAGTVVRPVPAALTSLRETRASRTGDDRPASRGGLAADPRTPDYVPLEVSGSAGAAPLNSLLDVHTKRMARIAPLAIFVVVALVVVIALSLR
jgi:hypothetical protein